MVRGGLRALGWSARGGPELRSSRAPPHSPLFTSRQCSLRRSRLNSVLASPCSSALVGFAPKVRANRRVLPQTVHGKGIHSSVLQVVGDLLPPPILHPQLRDRGPCSLGNVHSPVGAFSSAVHRSPPRLSLSLRPPSLPGSLSLQPSGEVLRCALLGVLACLERYSATASPELVSLIMRLAKITTVPRRRERPLSPFFRGSFIAWNPRLAPSSSSTTSGAGVPAGTRAPGGSSRLPSQSGGRRWSGAARACPGGTSPARQHP